MVKRMGFPMNMMLLLPTEIGVTTFVRVVDSLLLYFCNSPIVWLMV
jgi:hypothetical protein